MFISNKRRHARERHDPVIEFMDEWGRIEWTARMVDFSLGGLSFATDREIEAGAVLRGG